MGQQSHFLSAKALRVGRPFESFIGPGIPPMRAQKDLRRAAFLGDLAAALADTGGLRVPPVWALYEARPLALSPPAGFLPSLRCHAAVLGTAAHSGVVNEVGVWATCFLCTLFGCSLLGWGERFGLLFRVGFVPERFSHDAFSFLPCQPHSSQSPQPVYV